MKTNNKFNTYGFVFTAEEKHEEYRMYLVFILVIDVSAGFHSLTQGLYKLELCSADYLTTPTLFVLLSSRLSL